MPIYLEKAEKEYLKERLNGKKPKQPWWKKNILAKIESDDNRLERVEECNHTWNIYSGDKECCSKCGITHGISWEIQSEVHSKGV